MLKQATFRYRSLWMITKAQVVEKCNFSCCCSNLKSFRENETQQLDQDRPKAKANDYKVKVQREIQVTDDNIYGIKSDFSPVQFTDKNEPKDASRFSGERITAPTKPRIGLGLGRMQPSKYHNNDDERFYSDSEKYDNNRSQKFKYRSQGPDLMDREEADPFNQRHPGKDRRHSFLSNSKENQYQYKNKNYNYGLSGLGKTSLKKSATNREVPFIKGEALFGIHPVLLALESGKRNIHKLFIKPTLMDSPKTSIQRIIQLCNENGIKVEKAHKNTLEALSCSRPHQGVCLDASELKFTPLDIKEFEMENSNEVENPRKLWVVLDAIQDPMNFGAVLRSCYFFGVDRVVALNQSCCSLSPVVSKASVGALEVLPLFSISNMSSFVNKAKECGWDVIGTVGQPKELEDIAPDKVLPLHKIEVTKNAIIMMGNEGEGLSKDVLKECSHLVSIPPGRTLSHGIDSLNVSVATGVLLHQVSKKMSGK